MTDRLKGLTVAFDADIREDNAQAIINAIKMFNGVVAVEATKAGADDYMNRERIKSEFRQKLLEIFQEF
jgi:hypothetical protein